MNDTMKIFQALEDSNISLKRIAKTINNETKEQKGGLLGILFSTLGASLLGNMLTGKGMLRAGYGSKDLQSKGKEALRARYESKGFWIKKFFDSTPSFNKL